MILIIDKSKKNARRIAEMLYYMGFIAIAETPSDALSEISTQYKAAIIINPDKLADCIDYAERLHSYAAGVPLFAISDCNIFRGSACFEEVFKTGTYAARIAETLILRLGRNAPGTYKLAGIDASVNKSFASYFNSPLHFTKTETMILRALIKSYPRTASAKEILKYAFRASRVPELSNIRTHISVMNKKFREISGRNLIISEIGSGYKILTPEVMEKLPIMK